MRKVSRKSCRENQSHILSPITFFFFEKSCHFYDNVEKYGRARQVTGGNIIRRRKDARIPTRTHCCPTAKTVTLTHFRVTLYVHSLSLCLHKGKFTLERPRVPRRGVEVYIHSFFNLGHRWGGWSKQHPGRFNSWKETRYALYRKLGRS